MNGAQGLRWQKFKDQSSGRYYYYDPQTGLTSWEAPCAQPDFSAEEKSVGRCEDDVQRLIDVIASSLVSSGLSPEDGLNVLDVDKDGKVSLLDLQNALKQLDLDMAAAEGLHRLLDVNKEGFVDKALWVHVMASTNTENILKTRGERREGSEPKRGQAFLPALAYEGTRPGYVFKKDKQGLGYYWDLAGQSTVISAKTLFVPISLDDILNDIAPVTQCTEKVVYHLIGVIAASLASTGLSPEDGYDAFDVDGDGKVSLPDLQNALEQLDLDSAAADGLHRFLDVRKEGFVDRGLWVKEMASASTKAGIDSKSRDATRTRPQLEEQVYFSRLSCDVI